MNQIDKGFLLGFFTGDGSFGGDGIQPQMTLRMAVIHHGLLLKLCELLPGSQIYGPYSHGQRHYYQWMLRGEALEGVVQSELFTELGAYSSDAHDRYMGMVNRYFVDGKLRSRSKKRRRMTSSKGGSSTDNV